jgi:TolB-like protein/DNA-binding winged helix-turn-helix (wHTH) protein
MNRPDKREEGDREIDLARAASFMLGDITVHPSTREVVHKGVGQVLEPRVMQVLVALARADGAVVSREALCELCWGGRIVGEDALQRCIGILRRLGEAHPGHFTIETVARVGYRLERAGIMETPVGRTAAEVTRAVPYLHRHLSGELQRSRVAAVAAVGVLAAVLAVGVWIAFTLGSRAPTGATAIVAVLPFDDFSPVQDSKTFAKGLSEEILSSLARSRDIRVVARNSSFRFSSERAEEAAKALNATHVLEGSVRKEGDRLRVVAHLSNAERSTIWSETYDRPLTQMLILQSEIAERVADALGARLGADARAQAREMDPRAFEHYLKGRALFRARTQANLKRALPELEAAVRLAPSHIRSWTTLAAARLFLSDSSTAEGRALKSVARDAVDHALKLDPDDAEALGVKAQMIPYVGHWQEIDDMFVRALEGEPGNGQVLNWRAIFLAGVGRHRETLELTRRAYESDPLTDVLASNYARLLMKAGYLEAGRKIVDSRRGGWRWSGYEAEIDYLREKKDWSRLARWAAQPPPDMKTQGKQIVALIHDTAVSLAENRRSEFNALGERWKKLAHEHTWYADECVFFLWVMNEREAAVEVIVSLLQPDPTASQSEMPSFGMMFWNVELAADPRIVALMHGWGLFEYWRQSGHWPDFCADPALPYDCKAEAQRLASRQ